MADERPLELAISCLDDSLTDLVELRWTAKRWWPEEPDDVHSSLADAAVRWTLEHGYAELDAGNWSEPRPVPPECWDEMLRVPEHWEDSPDRRLFLRTAAAGRAVHQDREAWPSAYRERLDRAAAAVDAVSLERLAAELASRLSAACPDGYSVNKVGATIWVMRGPYGFCNDLNEMHESLGSNERTFENMIRTILDRVQQEFTEAVAMPWPSNTPSYLGAVFADPEVRVTDYAIEMWYGPETQPALVLAPIPFSVIAAD